MAQYAGSNAGKLLRGEARPTTQQLIILREKSGRTIEWILGENNVAESGQVKEPGATYLVNGYPRKEMESALRRTEEGFDHLRKAMANDLADENALVNTVVSDQTIVPPSARPVEIYELSIAAGGGALVDTEAGGESMWFRRDWLDRHALDPTQCSVFSVRGESMEETLPDGCSILVDRNQTRRRVGHIYVVRTEDGLVVKRAGKDEDGDWLLVSDHPKWKPLPWPDTAEVIGQVKWMAKTL